MAKSCSCSILFTRQVNTKDARGLLWSRLLCRACGAQLDVRPAWVPPPVLPPAFVTTSPAFRPPNWIAP